ncbi:MAG: hypothetical protein ACHQU8_04420 [Gemmatimonadales bacterium]
MNTLFLLGSVLGVMGLLLGAGFFAITGARARAGFAALAAAVWIATYAVLLVVSGMASREEVLRPGDTKYFCGFFLDCHIGVAVDGTRDSGHHVITLRFSSSARRATLSPYEVQVEVIGSDGGRYAARPDGRSVLERAIGPGGSYSVDVSYDLPPGVRADRLLVSQGVGIDRILDGLVIGNENSFLHKRTYLAI